MYKFKVLANAISWFSTRVFLTHSDRSLFYDRLSQKLLKPAVMLLTLGFIFGVIWTGES